MTTNLKKTQLGDLDNFGSEFWKKNWHALWKICW